MHVELCVEPLLDEFIVCWLVPSSSAVFVESSILHRSTVASLSLSTRYGVWRLWVFSGLVTRVPVASSATLQRMNSFSTAVSSKEVHLFVPEPMIEEENSALFQQFGLERDPLAPKQQAISLARSRRPKERPLSSFA